MSDRYIRTSETLEAQLAKVTSENAWHKGQLHETKMRLEVRDKELAEAKRKADHFDILMAAVKENEVVKGAWDKFMMALRLAGYDGTH